MCLGDMSVRSLAARSKGVSPSELSDLTCPRLDYFDVDQWPCQLRRPLLLGSSCLVGSSAACPL